MIGRNLNQNGNAMIAVIIGLVLLSGTCVELMTGGLSQIPNLIKSYRATSSRDSLEVSLMNRTSFAGIYRSSIHPDVIATGVNQELLVCIVGIPGQLCVANQDYPISLYSWETDTKSMVTSMVKIAGPAARPVSYNIKGNLCPSSGSAPGQASSCPFLQVTASFKATCAAGAPTCGQAENFQIYYSIKGAASDLSNGNAAVASRDRVANLVNINNILPPKIGTAAALTQVSSFLGNSGHVTQILQILARAGMTDTADAAALASLLQGMGITNPNMIYAIARSSWRDATEIQQFVDILTNNNITSVIAMNALALRSSLDPVLYSGIANAIAVAGITSQAIADQISNYHVTDPVWAAAFAVPKTQQILDLIASAARPWADANTISAIATGLYVAGITEANPGLVKAMAYGNLVNPLEITHVSNAIAGSGATNPLIINAIAAGHIGDVPTATQIVNTLTAIGATNQIVAAAISYGKITDIAQATNFYNTMVANPSITWPNNYANTGLTSSTTFNNFVTAIVASGLSLNESNLSSLGGIAIANNLTSVAEMQALINGAYSVAPTVAVAPTVIGTPAVLTYNMISGTCTVNCLAPSF